MILFRICFLHPFLSGLCVCLCISFFFLNFSSLNLKSFTVPLRNFWNKKFTCGASFILNDTILYKIRAAREKTNLNFFLIIIRLYSLDELVWQPVCCGHLSCIQIASMVFIKGYCLVQNKNARRTHHSIIYSYLMGIPFIPVLYIPLFHRCTFNSIYSFFFVRIFCFCLLFSHENIYLNWIEYLLFVECYWMLAY